MIRLRLFAVLCLVSFPAAAQTPSPSPRLVSWPEAIGFAALAGITFATDGQIRKRFLNQDSGLRDEIAAIGNSFGDPRKVFPAVGIATLGGIASDWDDLHYGGWRALKSTALATGTTLVLKTLIGRRRPDVTSTPYRFRPVSFTFNSLPSGHTTTAFALATSLAMESRSDVVDILLYGLATSTAFARMHVDKHWASDTVVGAGIGILAARFVRRHDHSPGGGAVTIAGSFSF